LHVLVPSFGSGGWMLSVRAVARPGSAVTEDDASAGQVVRAELHHDPVLREDPDVVLTHLARDVSQHNVTVGQLDSEHRVREGLHNGALDLNDAFLLRHVLHISECPGRVLRSTVVDQGTVAVTGVIALHGPHSGTPHGAATWVDCQGYATDCL